MLQCVFTAVCVPQTGNENFEEIYIPRNSHGKPSKKTLGEKKKNPREETLTS